MEFTRRRFLEFSEKQQHKNCGNLLKELYERGGELSHYNQIQEWMGLAPLQANDKKLIADRYHWHLTKAKWHLTEPDFLPPIRKGDHKEGFPSLPFTIYLDHLRSAHNVGSIVRTVEAMRLGTLTFSPDTPFISHPQVKKTAMGSAPWIGCSKCADVAELPRPIIAFETSSESIPLDEFLFPMQGTVAVGNEEYGCSESLLKAADYLVEIPLRGQKNSLNVANAFAIAAFEICRQQKVLHGQHN